MDNKKVFSMSVAKIYPLLVAKAERKGRTKEEVDEVCCWLTGYTSEQIEQQIAKDVSYETFFNEAPQMNANCHLITGSVCGVKVESIVDPMMQKIRWLDKLVDELAKGKPMHKILRGEVPSMELKFDAVILQNEDMDAAYVEVPYDIKELFGKGRLLVNATFDGVPYRGQVVKMGTPCYIIGITKAIRKQISKSFGDTVRVSLTER